MAREARELDPSDTMGALYGKRLRRYRLDAGWTQRWLGAKVHVVAARINQLERATGAKPTVELSTRLDEVLGTDGLLAELTPHVRREAFPDFARAHLDQEAVAVELQAYLPTVVHGLLQTEDYARALLTLGLTLESDELLEQRLSARMERQPRLAAPHLRAFTMVLDEAVLLRPVGGVSVMREQLARVLDAASDPRITVQVLPFASGAHPSMECSLLMATLPDGTESAYQEADGFGRLHQDTADVKRYARGYDRILGQALPPHLSLGLIRSVMEDRYGVPRIRTAARRRRVAQEQPQQHRGRRLPRSGARVVRRRPRPGQ